MGIALRADVARLRLLILRFCSAGAFPWLPARVALLRALLRGVTSTRRRIFLRALLFLRRQARLDRGDKWFEVPAQITCEWPVLPRHRLSQEPIQSEWYDYAAVAC